MSISSLVRTSAAAVLVEVGAIACNSTGTCTFESVVADPHGPPDSCTVNFGKRACLEHTDAIKTSFFPEPEAAGIARCKSLGFEQPSMHASTDGTKTFYKPKAPSKLP